ncbi:FtsX-like permease family protein [Streptomyces sp. NPDC018693]|uniref:FtsX-like permease family protein n=1 Tax=unclassified Streptomyces TaxID=2593676 RepID=UPI0037ACB7A5
MAKRKKRPARPVAAPWIRTRLRSAPGAALAFALLVAVTAALAAAFPRALDRYQDAGLRHAVDQAPHNWTAVQLNAPQPDLSVPQEEREQALRADVMAGQYGKILDTVRAPLVADAEQSTYGVRTSVNQEAPDPFLPRPSGLPARVTLVAQEGLDDHARVREGRLPRASGTVTAATAEVEAAVSVETAKALNIKVGSVLHVPALGHDSLALRVTGIVDPRTPDGPYWSTDALLHKPALRALSPNDPESPRYWLGALLLPPEAAPALLGTAGHPYRYWRLAPSLGDLHHQDLDALRTAVAAVQSGPGLQRIRTFTSPFTDTGTKLDQVLGSYDRLLSGVSPLISVAAFGTGTVVAVVLLMAGGLTADRRRTELALLRARGASLPGLTARLLAETAVIAVPAGALGLAVALPALPDARTPPAVLAAVAVTAVACVALPLRAAAAHRVVHLHTSREDVTSIRPSRRRTVAELTLVVIAAGAVEALRRQGTSDDGLVSAAPVLVGVIAALVLVRLYPLPLRGLARPAGRLRGFVAHLSLARAGRTSASAALPLLALLTALTTAAFGGSVLEGVQEARDRAALLEVGADARVESTALPLPAGLADRVGRVPGVRNVTAVSIAYQARPADERRTVPVVGVDPAGYAQLARGTGLGVFSAEELMADRASKGQGAGGRASAGQGAESAVAVGWVSEDQGAENAQAVGWASEGRVSESQGAENAQAVGWASEDRRSAGRASTGQGAENPASASQKPNSPGATGPASEGPAAAAQAAADRTPESPRSAAQTAAGQGPDDVLPALASRSVADLYGARPFPVRMEDGSSVTVRIAVVRDVTPAVTGGDFLVVDRAGLADTAAEPTALLVTGPEADGDALRRTAGEALSVRLRATERAAYADSPLQSGAERLYAAAVAAGAGYAVLALTLALLRTAPERSALLARLRTMGLTRAQGRRLLILESLPQAALAAAGGTLTGWATIRLLSPGLDLTVIALPASTTAAQRAELHTDALSLTVPALAVVAVTVGVAALQAWWSSRRGTVRELRVGDSR